MKFKSYATKLQTKSRMARKHARREVFVYNKKLNKLARKAARLERYANRAEE